MKSIKKNIELPENVVNILQKMADRDRRKLKPYMEKILIEYAAQTKKKPQNAL